MNNKLKELYTQLDNNEKEILNIVNKQKEKADSYQDQKVQVQTSNNPFKDHHNGSHGTVLEVGYSQYDDVFYATVKLYTGKTARFDINDLKLVKGEKFNVLKFPQRKAS